ncbi:MAG: hypothetical protein ABI541_02625 [Betaproteobacteria bacterium]
MSFDRGQVGRVELEDDRRPVSRRGGRALTRPYDNDGGESTHDGNHNQGADGAAPGKPASHNQYVPFVPIAGPTARPLQLNAPCADGWMRRAAWADSKNARV